MLMNRQKVWRPLTGRAAQATSRITAASNRSHASAGAYTRYTYCLPSMAGRATSQNLLSMSVSDERDSGVVAFGARGKQACAAAR
ncbi:hypothetical protein QF037_007791 [Streptomyces canus]|nr:hypothetical protein [Streptomyces canus]